jgi:hypothetical protein
MFVDSQHSSLKIKRNRLLIKIKGGFLLRVHRTVKQTQQLQKTA